MCWGGGRGRGVGRTVTDSGCFGGEGIPLLLVQLAMISVIMYLIFLCKLRFGCCRPVCQLYNGFCCWGGGGVRGGIGCFRYTNIQTIPLISICASALLCLGWLAEGPRFESASALLSLQKGCGLRTRSCDRCPSQLMKH